jgi:hypothetical protein
MAEREFAILKYERKVPAMAGCAKCQRKFFTPDTYYGDAIGAERYLLSKFNEHRCDEAPNETYATWFNSRHGRR